MFPFFKKRLTIITFFKADGDPWVLVFWMFQVVFAATAATIVSGAMGSGSAYQNDYSGSLSTSPAGA